MIEDTVAWNAAAWDRRVAQGNIWTQPASPEVMASARAGKWSVVLTPTRPVPTNWFPPLVGADVLALASGGGQQGPVLAAAGARVTVFDASAAQLHQDRTVAEREGLALNLEQGDMADLSRFPDESFDLVFNPCSTSYAERLQPIWTECHRVLRPGGRLMTGFNNPATYIFDPFREETGDLQVRFPLPYSDRESLDPEMLRRLIVDRGDALEWGHTWGEYIGGIIEAGFRVMGFYEDTNPGDPLSAYMPTQFAVLAERPRN